MRESNNVQVGILMLSSENGTLFSELSKSRSGQATQPLKLQRYSLDQYGMSRWAAFPQNSLT